MYVRYIGLSARQNNSLVKSIRYSLVESIRDSRPTAVFTKKMAIRIINMAYPLLKRYPVPIYAPGGYGVVGDPYSNFNARRGPTWLGPTSTVYGNCDCSLGSDYVQSNNCNLGYPVCVGHGNCICYRPDLGSGGCFNERGSSC